VFASGGYGGASVDQIAAEAGFSKGAFYSNFETKEAISLLAAQLQLHALRSAAFASAYKALNDEHEQQLSGLIAKLFQRAGKALPAKASELATLMMALPQGLALQRAQRPAQSDPSGKLIKLVLQSLLRSAARR
jgi:AcrR family transcriptional regulator